MAHTTLDDRPLTLEAMAAHLAEGCKPADQWRVGAEHEKFSFRLDSLAPISYLPDADGRGGVLALLTGLMRFGWAGIYEGETLIGLSRNGASVSLEPGGQFELSGAPLATMHDICAETGQHLEEVKAVADEIGADRCGIRLSPVTPFNDAGLDSDTQGLFNHLMVQLAPMKLAFVHVIEGSTGGPRDFAPFDYDALRALYKRSHPQGTWMLNNGYDRAMAMDAVASGRADAIAFGKPFISNPDLVRRLREDAPLAVPDAATMFGGDAKGYIDYPTLDTAP